jgi:predicted Fe-Mo cluster-binding NifX family protein
MNILISAAGQDLDSNIDTTFHWSFRYLIVDNFDNSFKLIENRIKNHPNELEDIINEWVKKEGIDAVITNEIGPRGFEEFKKHRIRIYQCKGNIKRAINQLEKGILSEIKNI